MGGRNGILVLNVSSLSLNGHLFHLEVGKGFYFKKRKSEIILMPSWVAGQRMMWGRWHLETHGLHSVLYHEDGVG